MSSYAMRSDSTRSDAVASTPVASSTLKSHAALVGRSFARARVLIAAMCVLFAIFEIALVVQAASQFEEQAFARMGELMPAFVRRTLGDLTVVVLSFQGVVTAAYFHPVILLLVAHLAIYLGTEPAHDVEAGLVDLLLARPVPRHALITRSLLLVLIASFLVPLTLGVSIFVWLALFAPAGAPWPTVGLVAEMTIGLAFVSACFGALALVIASRARRRASAIAVASILAVLCYLIVFLESTWAPARAIGWLSPFHYFRPISMLAGRGEPWTDFLVLGVAIAGLAGAAYWTFNRRDL